jgi:hypothetical protein
MGNSSWSNLLDPFPVARGTAANTFTTAKDISPGPDLPVAYGNEFRKGTKVILEAWGEYSTTGTPTFQLGFAYGITSLGGLLSTGITIAANTLAATTTTAAAWPWHMRYGGIITAVGTSGTLYGSGILDLATSLVIFGAGIPIPATAAARSIVFNTTVQESLSVFAQWGTSSVSNQVIVDNFVAKITNQGKTA